MALIGAAPTAPTPPFETARLTLRHYATTDVEALHDIQSSELVARFLYWGPRDHAATAHALAVRLRPPRLAEEGDRLFLAVTRRGEATLIGDIQLALTSAANRTAELGFLMHPSVHGRGYAREAAACVLGLAFDHLGLHRVIARCDARNSRSVRVLEAIGMRREAHFHRNEFVKGEWCDELVYALLAEEWTRRMS